MYFNHKNYKNKNFHQHSIYLRSYFNINGNGIDYVNKNAIKIEFKETFSNGPFEKRKFLCKKKDLNADFLVFCNNNELFYIVESDFLKNYRFKNKNGFAQPYLSTIQNIAVKTIDNMKDLKLYIENLTC